MEILKRVHIIGIGIEVSKGDSEMKGRILL